MWNFGSEMPSWRGENHPAIAISCDGLQFDRDENISIQYCGKHKMTDHMPVAKSAEFTGGSRQITCNEAEMPDFKLDSDCKGVLHMEPLNLWSHMFLAIAARFPSCGIHGLFEMHLCDRKVILEFLNLKKWSQCVASEGVLMEQKNKLVIVLSSHLVVHLGKWKDGLSMNKHLGVPHTGILCVQVPEMGKWPPTKKGPKLCTTPIGNIFVFAMWHVWHDFAMCKHMCMLQIHVKFITLQTQKCGNFSKQQQKTSASNWMHQQQHRPEHNATRLFNLLVWAMSKNAPKRNTTFLLPSERWQPTKASSLRTGNMNWIFQSWMRVFACVAKQPLFMTTLNRFYGKMK